MTKYEMKKVKEMLDKEAGIEKPKKIKKAYIPTEINVKEYVEDKIKEELENRSEKTEKVHFYSLSKILKHNAQYNMIIGERSNGKTYACLKYALERYLKYGEQTALVRRWQEDFVGKRGNVMFDALVVNKEVQKLSNGEFNGISYYASKWYLCLYGEKETIKDEQPFCYGFSITQMEHDKSTSYPKITTVIFDEFLTRSMYIPDEFVLFMNCLSTIIRHRNNVKIFMLGNTVNKYCPYFAEMGLTHIKEMKQGSIDVYSYGQSELKVAVEFCASTSSGKKSDTYFAFDNPKLQMIKTGTWEIDIYPHCPVKYSPEDVIYKFHIIFNEEYLECEVISKDELQFIFIHRKTSELKEIPEELVYTPEPSVLPNYRSSLRMEFTPLERNIRRLIRMEKVFFADNEVGEVFRNYVMWCGKS